MNVEKVYNWVEHGVQKQNKTTISFQLLAQSFCCLS